MPTGIFFDIDGTLRDTERHHLPESTVDTLHKLRKKGYFLAIATGRLMYEIADDIKDLIDWDAYVCANGQSTYAKNRELLSIQHFSEELINQCIEVSRKIGIPLYLSTESGPAFMTGIPNETVIESCRYFKVKVPPAKSYENEKILSMMAFGKSDQEFKDYALMDEIDLLHSYHFADIVLRGSSKHKGIEKVMQHYGLDKYIAFGDSLNDYEMLKNADISVAMGESHPDLIEIADIHTNKVSEDGIMKACEHLKLFDDYGN